MGLTIIRVMGPSSTGKSTAIREFTAKHLTYKKHLKREQAKGDVLGVFPMPRRDYAVGVNSYGDNLKLVRWGLKFLDSYRSLKVIIVACHTKESVTFDEVQRFAKKRNAICPPPIVTKKFTSDREIKAAIRANVANIKRLMPR